MCRLNFDPRIITFCFLAALESRCVFFLANSLSSVYIFAKCPVDLSLGDTEGTQVHALLSVCEWDKICANMNKIRTG